MKDGFIKAAAITPKIKVADVGYNGQQIRMGIDRAKKQGAQIIVFPELCITGYTCGDLFGQELLLRRAREELTALAEYTARLDALIFVGLPYEHKGKLYNVAAAVCRGAILGLVPKSNLPCYQEFYEPRQFTPGMAAPEETLIAPGVVTYIGRNQLFVCDCVRSLTVAAEICEDLWTPDPPSISHCMAGATVMVNLSASDEVTGKCDYRRSLVTGQSARLYCGYIYADAGEGESTQDVVYCGHNLIAEAGSLLAESRLFSQEGIVTELDLQRITARRQAMSTYGRKEDAAYRRVSFSLQFHETSLTRHVDRAPFVPADSAFRMKRCEEILDIQSFGLKKRLSHTRAKAAVIGISGGLDSTLALLVTVRAFDLLGWDRKQIVAVTMPGFGTTDRTYGNAVNMVKELGATLREVNIRNAVSVHFADIGHDPEKRDVTYENAQARERTQILMDIANREQGLVIGTGDMSELALGWATYNGDHMSMYGVNASVPKTLVRHLVSYYASRLADASLRDVLCDVLDTPVSPELLPPRDGQIAQKTEELVGPYELHDFFLYYLMRFGASPAKILRLATIAFADVYDRDTILRWEKTFFARFFSQQFKRSCLPDGPKVGTVSLSPRGDLRMPSDAAAAVWMEELEELCVHPFDKGV